MPDLNKEDEERAEKLHRRTVDILMTWNHRDLLTGPDVDGTTEATAHILAGIAHAEVMAGYLRNVVGVAQETIDLMHVEGTSMGRATLQKIPMWRASSGEAG